MKLTRIERQILANQNRILAHLNTDEERSFLTNAEILERGFEREYSSVFDVYNDDEVVPWDTCKETVDILQMFWAIQNGVASLTPEEKQTLEIDQLKFKGFDANNDQHYFYTQFMTETQGKWKGLDGVGLNSHSVTTISRYRRMLSVINSKEVSEKYELSLEDLHSLVSAANNK